jgi:hypothetical protein
MGRPLNKKYFGNRNIGSTSTTTDDGIGGQGVASVTISGTWADFASATTTVVFTAPQLPGGVTATGTATIVDGVVTAVVITEKGSGYTSAPTVTIEDSDLGAETTGSAIAVLTTDTGSAGSATNQENAIIVTAFIPAANGGTSAVIGDIVKQTNDRRYRVKTAQGTGICQLKTTAAANAAGEMTIKATDSEGKNYLVAKLTSRKVVLVPAALGGNAGTQFASGASAKWTFGTAVLNDTVKIENA